MTSAKKRVGIVLFQLGGPDSLQNVEPFLRNLFNDPDIIPLGPLNFIRRPLASYIGLVAFASRFRFSQPPDAQREPQHLSRARVADL